MDQYSWIAARILKVYALRPLTRSYLLTRHLDGRSHWQQGFTSPQGILEASHAVSRKDLCTTCMLLTSAHAANEVCPWPLFGEHGQMLEGEAASEPLHSTHVVVGPFHMLVWMRADGCSNQFCRWRRNAPVLPSQSPSTVGYVLTAGYGSSASGIQLRRDSQV